MVLGIKRKKKGKKRSYFKAAGGAVRTALGLVLVTSALGSLSN